MRTKHLGAVVAATALLVGGGTAALAGSPESTGPVVGGPRAEVTATLEDATRVMRQAGSATLKGVPGEEGPYQEVIGTASWRGEASVDLFDEENGRKVRVIGADVYVGGRRPVDGRHWAKLSRQAAPSGAFLYSSSLLNPVTQLTLAARGGRATAAGQEAIAGVGTTHYRFTATAAELIDAATADPDQRRKARELSLADYTAELWLNDRLEVVRIRIALGPGLPPLVADYADLGTTPEVTAPAADDLAPAELGTDRAVTDAPAGTA
ncbi:hypothetical protein ACWEQL_30065 [Kitasatospora sp. NPDC004240]